MEIIIKGPGEVVIRFIDRRGRTLVEERLAAFGSPSIESKRSVPLVVGTTEGEALLAPVLVHQSVRQQRVTFDGHEPAVFTRKRCQEIGCSQATADDAERGCAAQVGAADRLAPDGLQVTLS